MNYSYRIASIGERLAAFLAGITPNTIPIADETVNATATEERLMYAGKNL